VGDFPYHANHVMFICETVIIMTYCADYVYRLSFIFCSYKKKKKDVNTFNFKLLYSIQNKNFHFRARKLAVDSRQTPPGECRLRCGHQWSTAAVTRHRRYQ